MLFKAKIAAKTGIDIRNIPASYQILGDVMLLKFGCIEDEKKKIADAILRLYPNVKTVCEIKGVSGELRQPSIKKIAGNGIETLHKEHGIMYKLDVAKVMFSKGNHFERQRILSQVKKNENVVDMFAGIGYFSIGIAKHAKNVYAIEKNPVAFRYLEENIKLNKISNIDAMNADCSGVFLNGVADRVIMGYFPHTEKFLPFALKMLKKNGVVHFHNTYLESELWTKPEGHLKVLGNFKVLMKKKVKSVAPRCYHIVMDIGVSKV